MLEEAQQQVSEQPRPDLPLDRLLVVADEVLELERLLEFLEEGLDGPPCLVESCDGTRAPGEVIRDEGQLHVASVHLDDCGDTAQHVRIEVGGFRVEHAHGLVGEDAGVFVRALFQHLVDHVLLFAQDKENAAF